MFEKKEKPPRRFFVKSQEIINMTTEIVVIVDKETGVNYMGINGQYMPLLGKDGKVIVDEIVEYK